MSRALIGVRFDGFLLAGDVSNVEPARYGSRTRQQGSADPARDALALELVSIVRVAGHPLLGICRGLQEVNVAYGGTLRHLSDPALATVHNEPTGVPRDEQYLPSHEIEVADGGLLAELWGTARGRVNSLHTQAIDRLGDGLVVEAWADDGVIEAVSDPSLPFLLAVQWHPGWYAGAAGPDQAVFRAFGEAVIRGCVVGRRG